MDFKPKFKPLVVIQTYEDRESGRQFPTKVTERRSTLPLSETLQEKPLTRHSISGPACPPPPPPPPPFEDNPRENQRQNGSHDLIQQHQPKPKAKVAPPVPVKYSTLSYARDKQEYPQPPPCPTPDYDTISINSNSTLSKAIANRFARNENKTSQNNNDTVEMESLESYRLNNSYNPSNPWPKPPNIYFNNNRSKAPLSAQLSNGSTTSSSSGKSQRPVSVTIGEYPSGSLRKQPGKLDFLQNGSDEMNSNGSITSQFASELAHTLSRSNLRKRTESMENLLNGPQIKPQSNGSVTISLNNTLSKSFAKSTDNLTMRSMDGKSNRVTINISGDKKSEVPNGILKNGNGQLL